MLSCVPCVRLLCAGFKNELLSKYGNAGKVGACQARYHQQGRGLLMLPGWLARPAGMVWLCAAHTPGRSCTEQCSCCCCFRAFTRTWCGSLLSCRWQHWLRATHSSCMAGCSGHHQSVRRASQSTRTWARCQTVTGYAQAAWMT
jgi:hypothetical protein